MRGFAFCNDLYDPLPVEEVATRLAALGYTGIELDARCVGTINLPDFADHCARLGIAVVGFHWLLSGGPGLHLTHPSPDVRRATLGHLQHLARCCAALGGTMMVLGGGKRRSVLPGVSYSEARGYAVELLTSLGEDLVSSGVFLGIEPLGPANCNFINTAEAAAALADQIGCPNIGIALDARAMEAETASTPSLILSYASYLVHLHVNDLNRSGLGLGGSDLAPMLRAVKEIGYTRWISVEASDPSPDPDTVARTSLVHLRRNWPEDNPIPEGPQSHS